MTNDSSMSFASLGLSSPLLKTIAERGYTQATPVQIEAIPAIMQGRDLMAAAQTGTGKTAGFVLPLLDLLSSGASARSNQVRALILTPSRELAVQVGESVSGFARHLPLRIAVVYGGVKINPQMMKLRKGADVLVATPGRLLDLCRQNALRLSALQVLVLDEADRMLELGFSEEINKILAILPPQRQTLMFSATFSDEIRQLARGVLHKPVEISVDPPNSTARTVEQWLYPVDEKQKPALLAHLIKELQWRQVLVFIRTKEGADKLTRYLLTQGIKTAAIHGNRSQAARSRALAEFKDKTVQVLVATDLIARGMDIEQLPQVVNFELPKVAQDYIHRIGRTGRADCSGQAISLVSAGEFPLLSGIERLIQQLIPRRVIDGFKPLHPVPESHLDLRPIARKKPKKAKKPKKPSPVSDTE